MAVGVRGVRSCDAGNRGSGVVSAIRNFCSYRILVLSTFSLFSIATVSFLFSSHLCRGYHSGIQTAGNVYSPGNFLALNSIALQSGLDLADKQATDRIALVSAYAAYARKLKLEISRQLKMLDNLVKNLSYNQSKPSNRPALFRADRLVDEGFLRQFKKAAKDQIKIGRSMIGEDDEWYDTQLKIRKLKDTIFSVNELLVKAKKNGPLASLIAAKSIPNNLHCLMVRLTEEGISLPQKYAGETTKAEFEDPSLYHYAIFSDNVIGVSVVVNSAAKNAKEPWKHVFHIVTIRMIMAAMMVWFNMRPIQGGAHVEINAVEDYSFWSPSYVPVLRQLENLEKYDFVYRERVVTKNINDVGPKYLSVLNHLLFYLPEMYPKLHKILFLEDDVVVQKDMSALWKIDMDGKVNGAVEICSGPRFRYGQYLNFSNPLLQERFHPDACAWAFGMNMFDLDAWRRENCTEQYHYWQNLNENQTLWKSDTLPAGLMAFDSLTVSLDKSWHVIGVGEDASISKVEIKNAAVIHFSGFLKPWMDSGMRQFKDLWTKYVDSDMSFLQMCNFGR